MRSVRTIPDRSQPRARALEDSRADSSVPRVLSALEGVRVGGRRRGGGLSERGVCPVGGEGLREAVAYDPAMTDSMPSGPPSPSMRNLDRVMHLAREHGYRVGLQVGEHGRVVVHVRDMHRELRVIAILGDDIERTADALFSEMLKRQYVPRNERSRV